MSWNIIATGKPSEIKEKVAGAFKSSRSQSGHAPIIDAIIGVVDEAVETLPDGFPENYGYNPNACRKILVESSGHIDASWATASVSIKTFIDFGNA